MVELVRVLVAYGSTRGGTAGLAHMVADAFTRHHIRTEVRRAGDVKDPGGYDAVVVGGALYSNRWHPDAVTFVGRHRGELKQIPVWFFSSGPLDDSARSGALAPVPQVTAIAKDIDIRGHMTFGGLMVQRHSRLGGLFAWGPEGDFRDRHQVSEWVERIADELQSANEPLVRVVDASGQPVTPKQRRPTTVIVAPRPEPDTLLVDDSEVDEEELDVDVEAVELPRKVAARTTGAGLAKLRRYLTLDEEETDDEGLDLLLDNAEA